MIFNLSIGTAKRFGRTGRILAGHFGTRNLQSVSIRERQFPMRVRADLQRAIEEFFTSSEGLLRFCSVRQDMGYQAVTFAEMRWTA
jgi:hypothetical protein